MKTYEVSLDESGEHTQVFVHDGRSLAGRTYACTYLRFLVHELQDMRYYQHSAQSSFAAVRMIAESVANAIEMDVAVSERVVGMYAQPMFTPTLQAVRRVVLSHARGDFYRLQLESAFQFIRDYREEYLLAS